MSAWTDEVWRLKRAVLAHYLAAGKTTSATARLLGTGRTYTSRLLREHGLAAPGTCYCCRRRPCACPPDRSAA